MSSSRTGTSCAAATDGGGGVGAAAASSTRLPSINRTRPTPPQQPPVKLSVIDLSSESSESVSIESALLDDRNRRRLALKPHTSHSNGTNRPANFTSPTMAASPRLGRLYPQAAPDGSTSGFSSSNAPDPSLYVSHFPFVPRSLPQHLTQPSPVMSYWMNQLQWEKLQDHSQDIAIWERQLSDMLNHSGFDEVTPQRVALVCDLIDQISGHVGRWAPILRRIVRELFTAIYQNYDAEELEVTVPIWSQEGASWIGWETPLWGNPLDANLNDHAEAHPHDNDFHSFTFQVPPRPSDSEPPHPHFFRHELWLLNHATWSDIMHKYEESQQQMREHRLKVAHDLGLTHIIEEESRHQSKQASPVLHSVSPGLGSLSRSTDGQTSKPQGLLSLPNGSFSSLDGGASFTISEVQSSGEQSHLLIPQQEFSRPSSRMSRAPSFSLNRATDSPSLGGMSGDKHARPPSSLELRRQSIINGAKSAVIADREHRASPKLQPITAASMAELSSSNVGALLEQAMQMSKDDLSESVGVTSSNGRKHEEKENSNAPSSVTSPLLASTQSTPLKLSLPMSRTGMSTRPGDLADTEAATAAAFHTIHQLITTPPIPPANVIAYFDVEKRLNMQYDNLYRRIRHWAQKQNDLQKQSSTRSVVINRICRKLKFTIYWNIFHKWKQVVAERKRQRKVFVELFHKYHHSTDHLAQRFLAWRIQAMRKRTAALDRSIQEINTKNMVLQSEINEQKYIREKENEKCHVLEGKEVELKKERDELRHILDKCQEQIQTVQNAQVTRYISSTIGMIQSAIDKLWLELREARDANLQDPCRMLVSSTVLTEHINKPYSLMPEGSEDWVNARRDEVKRARLRFQHMLDSDLLLLWINYHAAQAHLKINQEKVEAKFYGATYKYDTPGTPQHMRHFYSNDASLIRRAENFTSSLQDCEVFLRLMSQVAPPLCEVDILSHVDLEVRGKRMLKVIDALNHDAASMITAMDLTHSFSPDLMAALIARLMMHHPTVPVDTNIFVDKKKKRKSEYAPDERRKRGSMGIANASSAKEIAALFGLSDAAANKAAEMKREEDRANALAAELVNDKKVEEESLMSHRDEAQAVAASRSRRNSVTGKTEAPTVMELEEEEASRAVKDCGPFTEVLRALHLINKELTTRARVEVNLTQHISSSVKKVMNDVRVLLDDAYERHQLWIVVRRRLTAFVSMVMMHQMRGEPLVMQDRKAIRQIRRYTKLLDRGGKPQPRFSDLNHPWNRTSNDHFFRRGITEESEDEDESDEDESADASKKNSDSEDNKSSDEDETDSDEEEAGTRNANGDDIWREYKPLVGKAFSALSKDDQDRELRRQKNRNETPDDLQAQLTFELSKMQEMIAKHYTSIRDIFRAYAQMDTSHEFQFKAKEDAAVNLSGMSKTAQKAHLEKEDKDDPTASIRRKLREQMAANAANSSGSSNSAAAHQDANPKFGIYEFWLLVRDCRLLNKNFTAKKIERIFEYVWARDLKQTMGGGGGGLDLHLESLVKDRTKMEVDCRQFVEILIRIAHQRMPNAKEREELLAEVELDREAENERKRAEGTDGEVSDAQRQMDALTRASISIGQTSATTPVGASAVNLNGASTISNPAFEWGTPLFPTTRPGLALRLFCLLRCRLIPSAARLNVDHFRTQYKRVEVSQLYKKHGAVLRKLFYRYAKMHVVRGRQSNDDDDNAGDAIWTNTIDYKELIQLLRDSKILDGRYLTLQQVYAIFSNVQADLAKVAPAPQEKDAKAERANKRGSLPKKTLGLTVNSDGSLQTPPSFDRTISGIDNPLISPTGRSVGLISPLSSSSTAASSQASSAAASAGARGQVGSAIWGANASESGEQTLEDLDLQHQAAASAMVPTDEQILASNATSSTELIFPEFLEALAAIACCRHPNPYKPIHVRLQQFLERDLLPWATLAFQQSS